MNVMMDYYAGIICLTHIAMEFREVQFIIIGKIQVFF